ncbi:uncharacterized protein LOC115441800 [Manduca sexta]|uniref:MYND-type domain-containing protein n=1 Tax=Manduca sexta TaxID=7130 RepID=A0A921YZG6_MANSE|nr:uncharacterized protein LOC115441800 [Manduca sexta]XP_030022567.1 uncharacterized protein LOC115441800 [Manduca sexta]KAG6447482.1 hypothetical protein O3G_MSEX005007 [Manduca sexta]KAG6447483.1 hypothetical protein O3G_MSEX005007 [Manduca sexta]
MDSRVWPFNFTITTHPFMKDIYEALDNDDPSTVVITALHILRRINLIPQMNRKNKCERNSESLRKSGNDMLKPDRYQEAMEYYNEALMYAPQNSRSMKVAFGNRSFIYYKQGYYPACVADIKMALEIPTATEIDDKLRLRLHEASNFYDEEAIRRYKSYSIYGPTVYKLSSRNPDIPCASADISVALDRRAPKVVAKRNIKIGAVLAIEEAFTIGISKLNYLNSCYYCSKRSLNLIPCTGCCWIVFCDAKCRQNSFNEGHNIECQIMEVVEDMTAGPMPKLVIKTVLKIRKKCKNWKEFIDASWSVGRERWKKSSIKEVFDVDEKFSMLCFNDDRLFIHGTMCNTSFACATVIHHLDRLNNFFPNDEKEKLEAMRAMGRMMMFLVLHTIPTTMNQALGIANPIGATLSQTANFGWFSFIGKLRHACIPNACAINLNRRMVVIASAPIKAGTPITIHYLGCHVDVKKITMNCINLYTLYGMVCNCILCIESVKVKKKQILDDETKKKLRDINGLMGDPMSFSLHDMPRIYPAACSAMDLLKNLPLSDEYDVAKDNFLKCLVIFSDYECGNKILDSRERVIRIQ